MQMAFNGDDEDENADIVHMMEGVFKNNSSA